MIPEFVDGLNLPTGGHFCTIAEIEARFTFNDHRKRLFQTLINVLKLAKRCGFLRALLGGSFPTGKDEPKDFDIMWFCAPGTSKTTVAEECIKIMEYGKDGGEYLFTPFDEGSLPEAYPEKLQLWSSPSWLGRCDKTGTPRGVLLVDLEGEDDRLL